MSPRRITLKSRDGVELEADYEPHELKFMAELRAGLDGPNAEWDRETMFAIHELKGLLPGSYLEPVEETHAFPAKHDVAEETRRAIQQVDEHADEAWKAAARDALRLTCESLEDFISDDVWTHGNLDGTREDRALGPIFLWAKREGLCEKTDRMRPSVRSHLSGKPVWRSLIYSP